MTESVPGSRETRIKDYGGISQVSDNQSHPIGFHYSPRMSPYYRDKVLDNNLAQSSSNENLEKGGAFLPNQDQNRPSKSLSPLRKTPLSARQKRFEGSEFNVLNKNDTPILRSPKKRRTITKITFLNYV